MAAVRIPAVRDVDDRHGSRRVVDAVDDAVSASPGAVTIIEGGVEAPADSLRVVQQRPGDELVCGESNSLGQMLRKLTSRRRRDVAQNQRRLELRASTALQVADRAGAIVRARASAFGTPPGGTI